MNAIRHRIGEAARAAPMHVDHELVVFADRRAMLSEGASNGL